MHEFSIAEEIKNIVLNEAKKQKAKKINKIVLQIGHFTSIVPDALKFAFETLTQNTELEKTFLEIEIVETSCKCEKCKKIFKIKDLAFECPFCKSNNFKIISGKEMLVKSIEME